MACSKSSTCVVPTLLFAAPTKAALEMAESLAGKHFSGLNQAASCLAKHVGSPEMQTQRNKACKMLRHLQQANAMERHFTQHGAEAWLSTLSTALNAVIASESDTESKVASLASLSSACVSFEHDVSEPEVFRPKPHRAALCSDDDDNTFKYRIGKGKGSCKLEPFIEMEIDSVDVWFLGEAHQICKECQTDVHSLTSSMGCQTQASTFDLLDDAVDSMSDPNLADKLCFYAVKAGEAQSEDSWDDWLLEHQIDNAAPLEWLSLQQDYEEEPEASHVTDCKDSDWSIGYILASPAEAPVCRPPAPPTTADEVDYFEGDSLATIDEASEILGICMGLRNRAEKLLAQYRM
jgi:hypothetical protein